MPVSADRLPDNVLDALRRGNSIESIKLLRETTGIGLKEAKDAIGAHLHGNPLSVAAASANTLPPAVLEALQRGKKIEAIRLLREQTGLGLKEAKDAVEASHQRVPATADMLSPGEVPRSGNAAWIVVALALAAIVVWYFLRAPG